VQKEDIDINNGNRGNYQYAFLFLVIGAGRARAPQRRSHSQQRPHSMINTIQTQPPTHTTPREQTTI
jgi:hypothetical protein